MLLRGSHSRLGIQSAREFGSGAACKREGGLIEVVEICMHTFAPRLEWMELDWYSKKQFSSKSARRVATVTTFMSHVGSRLLLVKPLCKRLSKSVSLAPSSNFKKWNDCDDYLDVQPKCMLLGRSRRWVFAPFDGRARRKQHRLCYACVLHIWALPESSYLFNLERVILVLFVCSSFHLLAFGGLKL